MAKTKRKKSTFERLRRGELNRKQRRDLARRLAGNDPGLTIIHSNAGGIDVGNESHFVAVPPDRDANPVQEFRLLDSRSETDGGVVKRLPNRYRGDAGHRGLLHPALRHFDRAWHSGGSGERPAHQERARPQERCAGVSMAHEVTHLWAVARLVPAGGADGGRAHDLAVARPGEPMGAGAVRAHLSIPSAPLATMATWT
jgi:hypothetical protein